MKRTKFLQMRYLLVFNICLLFLTLQAYPQDTINVITHNVLAFSGHPKETHKLDTAVLGKAIRYYKSKNVDVLILQECPPENYVKILADSLHFNYSFFKEKYSGSNIYPYGFPGCIMSKYEIDETSDLNTGQVKIPDTLFQRHLGSVILRTPIGLIQFTGLHLCANHGNRFREKTRMKELDIMLSYVQNCDSCVANIVAGDFNSKPFSNPYNKMISSGFIDTHEDINDPTVPVPDSKSRIDYIFIDGKSKLTFSTDSIRVPYYADLELFLSDHQPCMTRLIKE